MADIDVQRKTPMTWLWVLLGLVVLGLLLLWLLTGTGRDQMAVVDDPAMEPVPTAPADPAPVAASVQQYRQECAPAQPGEMGLDHQHTANCIRTLAAALEDVAPQQQHAAIQGNLENARDAAQRLEQSAAEEMNHSQMARDGFTSIASAFEQLEQQWQPDLQAQQVRQSAEAVDPGQPLLDQRQETQQFFSHAGNALDRVARHDGARQGQVGTGTTAPGY